MGGIVIMGDAMIDLYSIGESYRLSPEAPVPVITQNREEFALGGAANVALNVYKLGGEVSLLTVSGEMYKKYDWLCPEIIKDGRRSTIKERIMIGNHQVARRDYEDITPIGVETAKLLLNELKKKSPSVVVISDYNKGVVTDYLISEIMSYCSKEGCKSIIDPKDEDKLYYNSTIITPNRREAELMSQMKIVTDEDVSKAAKEILYSYNSEYILITLAEKGMYLLGRQDGDESFLPAIVHDVNSVIGAGDTVVATLAWGIEQGYSILESVKLANKAAGIVVQKKGTAYVTKEELL